MPLRKQGIQYCPAHMNVKGFLKWGRTTRNVSTQTGDTGWEVRSHSLSFPVLTWVLPLESSPKDIKGWCAQEKNVFKAFKINVSGKDLSTPSVRYAVLLELGWEMLSQLGWCWSLIAVPNPEKRTPKGQWVQRRPRDSRHLHLPLDRLRVVWHHAFTALRGQGARDAWDSGRLSISPTTCQPLVRFPSCFCLRPSHLTVRPAPSSPSSPSVHLITLVSLHLPALQGWLRSPGMCWTHCLLPQSTEVNNAIQGQGRKTAVRLSLHPHHLTPPGQAHHPQRYYYSPYLPIPQSRVHTMISGTGSSVSWLLLRENFSPPVISSVFLSH